MSAIVADGFVVKWFVEEEEYLSGRSGSGITISSRVNLLLRILHRKRYALQKDLVCDPEIS